MTVMIGRLGAVFGIIVFGTMIDTNCFMIFYFLAILLLSEYGELLLISLLIIIVQ